jgi:hypothetical protein
MAKKLVLRERLAAVFGAIEKQQVHASCGVQQGGAPFPVVAEVEVDVRQQPWKVRAIRLLRVRHEGGIDVDRVQCAAAIVGQRLGDEQRAPAAAACSRLTD